MTDKREQILARLFAVLQAVPGTKDCVRNRGELPDDNRPAIYLLDGDENSHGKIRERGPSLAAAPNLIALNPEIYLSLEGRKPDNTGAGEALNAFRAIVVKAILTDANLVSLCGTNGEILYNGCITDLARGRAMNGEMGLNMTFVYVLRPMEL